MAVQVTTSIGSDFTADVSVRGALRFDTVSSIYRKLKFGENGCKRFRIDLSGVEGADSAGVALCLSWIESARSNDVQIEFICVPENMMRLLRVNQVDELFKVAHAI